ncbi:SprT family zinc-dependent metalloprotease [Anditalea andensis]|uniref:Transcription elongation protein SprT n=1 Tax=Anditalea andensis TaxID=1048983 RepID=A0A074KVE9_9BACT|nr:SprT-like domain-containing protein [Anditalea andensis]KEO72914.1 transcription elongation protein SprT [Anditalea andensis]
MNINKEIFQMLQEQVPENAAQYCFDLWLEDPFHFIISKSRSSKLGDFRFRSDRKIQTITINYDLNPYQFLITYIHEVAHYRAFKRWGINIKPHGTHWKNIFRSLMAPILSDLIFPRDILIPLKRHLLNPKASSGADLFLNREVRKYDLNKKEGHILYLNDIKVGEEFMLKGRLFKKENTRRTRVLCLEIASGKKYLVSVHAEVERN